MAMRVFTAVLIVACPCGLALARPLTGGFLLRALARTGLLVRDADVLQRLTRIRSIVFDKTGTLTTPDSGAMRFHGDYDPAIGTVAAQSGHPLSRMISRQYPADSALQVADFAETPGMGISAQVDGRIVTLGRAPDRGPSLGSQVHCEIDGEPVGYFAVETALRPGIGDLLQGLARHFRLALLSGDGEHERGRFAVLFRHLPEQAISIACGIIMIATALLYRQGLSPAPVRKPRVPQKPGLRRFLVLGALNAFLPCGLLVAALALAAGTGSALGGAIVMLSFGLTTLLTFALAGRLSASPLTRHLAGPAAIRGLACAAGLLLVLRGLALDIPYLSPAIQDGQAACQHCTPDDR
jgi:hypothetical protein